LNLYVYVKDGFCITHSSLKEVINSLILHACDANEFVNCIRLLGCWELIDNGLFLLVLLHLIKISLSVHIVVLSFFHCCGVLIFHLDQVSQRQEVASCDLFNRRGSLF